MVRKSSVRIIEMPPMKLLPPAPHLCQTCAYAHKPEEPHNAQTLYYQTDFLMKHGRKLTWKDALEHCDEEIRAYWEAELRKKQAWTEPEADCGDSV